MLLSVCRAVTVTVCATAVHCHTLVAGSRSPLSHARGGSRSPLPHTRGGSRSPLSHPWRVTVPTSKPAAVNRSSTEGESGRGDSDCPFCLHRRAASAA
jgi:hypothetical protein